MRMDNAFPPETDETAKLTAVEGKTTGQNVHNCQTDCRRKNPDTTAKLTAVRSEKLQGKPTQLPI